MNEKDTLERDALSPTEQIVRQQWEKLEQEIDALLQLQRELPRCREGGSQLKGGPCVKYLGHPADHGSSNGKNYVEWPNHGPGGKGYRR